MTFSWSRAMERIPVLMDRYPGSHEMFRFWRPLAEFQKSMADHIDRKRSEIRVDSLREIPQTFPVILPFFADFLKAMKKYAPGPIAMAAHDMLNQKDAWNSLMEDYLLVGAAALDRHPRFLVRAFLQPLMHAMACSGIPGVTLSPEADVRHCSFCGEIPMVGVLRENNVRSVICILCLTEWPVPRAACMACGETRRSRLARLTSEDIAHVSVEACATCKKYIKVVDTTSDAEAVPIVDDLATLSLDAAAREHGYSKSDLSLAGL